MTSVNLSDIVRSCSGEREGRFWSHVEESDSGCWLWRGALNKDGYGLYRISRPSASGAHRASFYFAYGYLPKELDHLCRVRNCVNPEHLEPCTRSENITRGYRARMREAVKRWNDRGRPQSNATSSTKKAGASNTGRQQA